MGPGVTYIDLRPNGTVSAGRAICYAPSLPVSGLIDTFGDVLDDPSPAIVNLINSRLGITLTDATTLREIIVELFQLWSGGSRWRGVRGGTKRLAPIYLGGEVIGEVIPPFAGMSPYTETWTKADSTNITADLTWTEVSGTALAVSSNKLRYTGAVNPDFSMARAEHQIGSNNQQVEATLIARSWSSTGYLSGNVIGRKDNTSTLTYYRLNINVNEGQYKVDKNIAGTATNLIASGVVPVDGDVIQLKMDGSSIGWARNGGAFTSVTDTAISEGLYAGVEAYSGVNTGDWIELDTWSVQDLSPRALVTVASPLRW